MSAQKMYVWYRWGQENVVPPNVLVRYTTLFHPPVVSGPHENVAAYLVVDNLWHAPDTITSYRGDLIPYKSSTLELIARLQP